MNVVAIIPARSRSKRFRNKNLALLCNKPLILHSINFAKKLKFVNKIIFTTDSNNYINLVKNYSNLIVHKRSSKSSSDKAMEEDILLDIKKKFKKEKKDFPTNILWLRPTHPLRCIKTFKKAYLTFKKFKETVMVVHKAESRLYKNRKGYLFSINPKLQNRSMIRSQDCSPLYSIFSGEFFRLKKISKNFLGKKKKFIIAPKFTNFDIDNAEDLEILNNLVKSNKKKYKKFIHV